MTENDEAAEKTRKFQLAQEAKRILSEPLIEGFFDGEEAVCLEAFRRLPMGATIEEYQTLHHNLLASVRLKLTLQAYIEDHEMVVFQERRGEKMADGI